MSKYKVTDTQLKDIAAAIRAKANTAQKLSFPNGFVSKIESIEAKLKSSDQVSAGFYTSSTMGISAGAFNQIGSFEYPASAGRLRSVTLVPPLTTGGLMYAIRPGTSLTCVLYAYNPTNSTIVIPRNTHVGCIFTKYEAYL